VWNLYAWLVDIDKFIDELLVNELNYVIFRNLAKLINDHRFEMPQYLYMNFAEDLSKYILPFDKSLERGSHFYWCHRSDNVNNWEWLQLSVQIKDSGRLYLQVFWSVGFKILTGVIFIKRVTDLDIPLQPLLVHCTPKTLLSLFVSRGKFVPLECIMKKSVPSNFWTDLTIWRLMRLERSTPACMAYRTLHPLTNQT